MKTLYEVALKVVPVGNIGGSSYQLDINDHTYIYQATADVWKTFMKIFKFSQGRALAWWKKNTTLLKGSMKEGRMADVWKQCNMTMKQFVQYRDIIADPDTVPQYATFKVTGPGISATGAVFQLKDVNRNNTLRFWKDVVMKKDNVHVPPQEYEIMFDEFDDSRDDFVIGFGKFDEKTKTVECYAMYSKTFERLNNVSITSYIEM